MNNDLSIVIPVRVDSLERSVNLFAVIEHISSAIQTNIIVLEADKSTAFDRGQLSRFRKLHVKHLFVQDSSEIFHRTRYIILLVVGVGIAMLCWYRLKSGK